MKILLTGGAGFIGSRFATFLLQQEYSNIESVVILDKLTYAGTKTNLLKILEIKNVEFIQGDICDQSLVDLVLQKIDTIINFAAESHVDRSIQSSAEFIQTNITGVQMKFMDL